METQVFLNSERGTYKVIDRTNAHDGDSMFRVLIKKEHLKDFAGDNVQVDQRYDEYIALCEAAYHNVFYSIECIYPSNKISIDIKGFDTDPIRGSLSNIPSKINIKY